MGNSHILMGIGSPDAHTYGIVFSVEWGVGWDGVLTVFDLD